MFWMSRIHCGLAPIRLETEAPQPRKGMSRQVTLVRMMSMSLPAVMQHLAVLESSGLVRSEKSGRVRTCRIEAKALSQAEQWISQRRNEWEQNLDRLGDYLKTLQA